MDSWQKAHELAILFLKNERFEDSDSLVAAYYNEYGKIHSALQAHDKAAKDAKPPRKSLLD